MFMIVSADRDRDTLPDYIAELIDRLEAQTENARQEARAGLEKDLREAVSELICAHRQAVLGLKPARIHQAISWKEKQVALAWRTALERSPDEGWRLLQAMMRFWSAAEVVHAELLA